MCMYLHVCLDDTKTKIDCKWIKENLDGRKRKSTNGEK